MPLSRVISTGIQDGTIVTTDLADNAVNSAKIGVDVIVADDLAANSVTVSEITDGAVTGAKLANNLNYDSGTLYLDSTNNRVGIGTNSPSGKFHVLSNSDVRIAGTGNSHYTYFYSNNTTAKGSIASLSSSLRVQAQSSGDLELFNTSNSGIIVKNSGNVGIGTASVDEKLDVNGNAKFTGTGRIIKFDKNGSGEDNAIYYDNTTANNNLFIGRDSSNLAFRTGGSERMRIDAGGSVLIGKSTPTDLHNTWNHLIIGEKGAIISENGGGGIDGISISDNAYIDSDTGAYAYQTTDEASIISQTGGNIIFSNAASGSAGAALSFSERMRITSGGSVAIGTNTNTLYYNSTSTYNSSLALKTNTSNEVADIAIINGNNNFGSTIDFARTNTSSNDVRFASLGGYADSNTAGSESGHIRFSTKGASDSNIAERMRIDSSGRLLINNTGSMDLGFGAQQLSVRTTGGTSAAIFGATNSATSSVLIYNSSTSASMNLCDLRVARSNNTAFNFFEMRSNSAVSNDSEFRFKGDGNAQADGSFSGGGADYAEYFEWADGNANNEDRRGYTVVLDNNKIRKSTSSDDVSIIIGVVSGNPSMVGDSDINQWKHKYQRDDYGTYIRDANGERTPNPAYNSSLTYTPREERQEWDTIGLMGKLRLRAGQPTGDRWIKMRDVSETVEEWLVR